MSEEEKIERLLNSIAKGCDGSIADEVKAIIIKQQKEIDRLNRKQADDEMLKDTFIERDYISRDKIRKIIIKYINVQGLDSGPLKNMVNELLEEK